MLNSDFPVFPSFPLLLPLLTDDSDWILFRKNVYIQNSIKLFTLFRTNLNIAQILNIAQLIHKFIVFLDEQFSLKKAYI